VLCNRRRVKPVKFGVGRPETQDPWKKNVKSFFSDLQVLWKGGAGSSSLENFQEET